MEGKNSVFWEGKHKSGSRITFNAGNSTAMSQGSNRKEHHCILYPDIPLCNNKSQRKIFSNIEEIKKYCFHKDSYKN